MSIEHSKISNILQKWELFKHLLISVILLKATSLLALHKIMIYIYMYM